MRRDTTVSAITQEEELQKQIDGVKKQNEELKEVNAVQLEQIQCRPPTPPSRQEPDDDMGDGMDQMQGTGPSTSAAAEVSQQQNTKEQKTEHGQVQEAGPSASVERMSMAAGMKLYQDELIEELRKNIQPEEEKHWQGAKEYEIRVLNSINIEIIRPGKVNEQWYCRHLPLPLMKIEEIQRKVTINREMDEADPRP